MKTIVIGDIHGRTIWKDIINKNEYDKLIFIGDYFDSRDPNITAQKQIDNFNEILQLKKDNFDKVILLFGNHEFHYLNGMIETYSGFQYYHSLDIGEAIQNALKLNLLNMCYIQDNFLFSHAGITKTWLSNQGYIGSKTGKLDEFVNDLFKNKPRSFIFKSGSNHSQIGDDITQSPIWVRPNSLLSDTVEGFTHVVGHTSKDEIKVVSDKLILIDCLGNINQFLVINDGVVSIGSL